MKRWEYRNIHLLLAPVYLRMLYWCLRYRVTPMGLLKANFALDHGGATFASKFGIQSAFPDESFPPTILVRAEDPQSDRAQKLIQFGENHGFPFVAKPDIGRIGFGVTLIHDASEAKRLANALRTDYMAQAFAPGPLEFGVFYVRLNNTPMIFSINSKEFPSVIGDGLSTVETLLEHDSRLKAFMPLFNRDVFSRTPDAGERVQLSAVGSHTLGCVFCDATGLATPAILDGVHRSVGVDGFNFGRLDVRTASIAAFQRGEFQVIEVNGVESLATNAFDPSFSYWQGLGWFNRQFRLLVQIASEHRSVPMKLLSYRAFFRKVRLAEQDINETGSLVHFSSAETTVRSTRGLE